MSGRLWLGCLVALVGVALGGVWLIAVAAFGLGVAYVLGLRGGRRRAVRRIGGRG